MANATGKVDDAAHYASQLAGYRRAWHDAFYQNTTDASCVVNGAEIPSCHCPGKLSAVAMECENAGHGIPPPTCGADKATVLELACKPGGGTITKIKFAAYGQVTGNCGSGFSLGSCFSTKTKAIVEAACLGKTSCAFNASIGAVAGGEDPCPGKAKILAVEAAGCEPAEPVAPPAPRSAYAGDTQTGNTIALYLDVPPTSEIRKSTVDSLVAAYNRAGRHPEFGTVGARYFLPVLAANGQMDLALDFATKTSQPSYGFMVRAPA